MEVSLVRRSQCEIFETATGATSGVRFLPL